MSLTLEEIESYEACTCLVRCEITHLYDKFAAMDTDEGGTVTMPQLVAQEELRNNPFRHRLCQIFSSEPINSPTSGDLTFDEFVDLYHCLSPRASTDTKMQTAFRMFDFDGNGFLTTEDLEELLLALAKPPRKGKCLWARSDVRAICERVMRDCARPPVLRPPLPSPIPIPLPRPAPEPRRAPLDPYLTRLPLASHLPPGDIDGNGRLSYAEFTKMMSRVTDFHQKFSIITTFTPISDGRIVDPAFDPAPIIAQAPPKPQPVANIVPPTMSTFTAATGAAVADGAAAAAGAVAGAVAAGAAAAGAVAAEATAAYAPAAAAVVREATSAPKFNKVVPKKGAQSYQSEAWQAYIQQVYDVDYDKPDVPPEPANAGWGEQEHLEKDSNPTSRKLVLGAIFVLVLAAIGGAVAVLLLVVKPGEDI